MRKISAFFIISVVVFASCKRPETLKEAYQDDFLIGAAVTTGAFQSLKFTKMYNDEIMSNFNLLVGENAMKPEVIHSRRGPDYYNYQYADVMVDYAMEHGMAVRGHTLVWHSQTPANLVSTTMTKEEARNNMKEYITAEMTHYKGKIKYWDVVNEAISDDSSITYREGSSWYIAYGGPEYIQDAFRFASEADPDAVLIYNDYSIINKDKRDSVVKMINDLDLIECGLDEVGMQAHWQLQWPPIDMIQETIDTFYAMGLKVQFTELDIDCYNGDYSAPEMEYTKEIEAELTKRYKDIFTCFKENSEKISAVTFWGVADDHSWLHKFSGGRPLPTARTNYPLLFDTSKEPKEAYYKLLYLR